MTAERLTEQSTAMIEVRRDDFGPGKAGDSAFAAVSIGAPCATWVDDNRKECGNLPIGTVDKDASGTVDFFPYCSEEHARQLEHQLVLEMESQGRFADIWRNGFHRN